MRATLEEILALQRQYSPLNSSAMQRRGVLIRDVLPAKILENSDAITRALGSYGTDLRTQGRDATGRKSQVPWVRIFSQRMSPKPGTGWYLVYLFHADASGVSLCLSHGSTSPKDGSFQTHRPEDIDRLMTWARGILQTGSIAVGDVRSGVSLGKQKLAAAYEKTTALSKFYPSGKIPDEAVLQSDLVALCSQLGAFYFAQEASHSAIEASISGPTDGSPDSTYPIAGMDQHGFAEPDHLINTEDARRRIEAQIVVRQGGAAFRKEALTRFGRRCAISGWCVEAVLEAAHIVPHLGSHTDRADNALLLRSDIHTLFDLQLLRIDPENLRIQLAFELRTGPYADFAGQEVNPAEGVTVETFEVDCANAMRFCGLSCPNRPPQRLKPDEIILLGEPRNEQIWRVVITPVTLDLFLAEAHVRRVDAPIALHHPIDFRHPCVAFTNHVAALLSA